ncbi:MAG TPA: biotin/lipoyl-binding protein [Candidatus Saccharimonadaceae bacterium]|nr:biotin/lipoyl-binding protein [Candidatus Saccharimonadaceae bacterium]
MKFLTRIKFSTGLLVVILIVGALTLYLNAMMSTAQSFKAQIGADTQGLGSDFPGVVSAQNVNEGDKVKKGEILFEVNSPELTQQLNAGTIEKSQLTQPMDPKTGAIEVTAPAAGAVQKVYAIVGSSVQADAPIVDINPVGSLYAIAYFHLNTPDYARIHTGSMMTVTLPDNTKVQAKTYTINLKQDGSTVETVIKARFNHPNMTDFRFAVGTPVDATLKINDKPWYQSLFELVRTLFEPRGA